MELENQLAVGLCGADVDVRLFTNTNLVAETVDRIAFPVGVHSKIVETAVGETIAIVSGVLDLCDQAILGEGRDVSVNSTPTTLA